MQIDSFLKYIRYELNYSVHTVLSYSKDLSQFVEFLSADKETFDAASVTVADVRAWVYSLNSSGFSVRSVRRKVQSLRAFYKFLRTCGKFFHIHNLLSLLLNIRREGKKNQVSKRK